MDHIEKIIEILKEHQERFEDIGNLQDQQCEINKASFDAIRLTRELLLGLIDMLVEKDVIVPGDVIKIVKKTQPEEQDND